MERVWPYSEEDRWKPKVRESQHEIAEDAGKVDEPSLAPRSLQLVLALI